MTTNHDPAGCRCLIHIEDTVVPTASLQTRAELEDWTEARGVRLKGDYVSLADAYALRAAVDTETLARVMADIARDAEAEAETQAAEAHAETNGVCPYAALPRERTDRDRRAWLTARKRQADRGY